MKQHTATIPLDYCGERIDKTLAQLFPDYSRAKHSQLLADKKILVDGKALKPKDKVKGGETVILTIDDTPVTELVPEELPINIVYEDEALLVINKPADLVVHPGAGNPSATLVNGLLFLRPALNTLPRAGIIHRLDKDTTGLLIIAKTLAAHTKLVQMMQQRLIHRHYLALVYGEVIAPGSIETTIGRHPTQRTKMAVTGNGKPAITHYSIREYYPDTTLLDIKLDTGRTHQIRVHMQHIGYPIVGDPTYGKRHGKIDFTRQALHAYRLAFDHPITNQALEFNVELPNDFQQLLDTLDNDDTFL